MKKAIFGALMLTGVVAYAQDTNGKVGINTTTPQATLEIQPSAANLAGTTNEGLLIPRLTKARVVAMPSPANATQVYVTDEVLATDTKFSGTGKGYYYYDSAKSKWIKFVDTDEDKYEWLYDAKTNRINLIRSGRTSEFTNKVFYDNSNGNFVNTTDLSKSSSLAKNVLYATSDKLTGDKVLNYTELQIPNIDTSKYVRGDVNILNTSADNANNYDVLIGRQNIFTHYGTGGVKYLIADYSDARLDKGASTGYVTAYRGTASYDADQSSKDQTVFLGFNQVLEKGTGHIENMAGFNSYTGFYNTKPLTIDNIYGYTARIINQGTGDVTAGSYKAFNFDGLESTSRVSYENIYGLYLGSITTNTSKNNYAIYTNAGKVHFGDSVETAGVIKIGGYSTLPCDSTNEGTIKYVAEFKKFQGCIGSNWVDLNN